MQIKKKKKKKIMAFDRSLFIAQEHMYKMLPTMPFGGLLKRDGGRNSMRFFCVKNTQFIIFIIEIKITYHLLESTCKCCEC